MSIHLGPEFTWKAPVAIRPSSTYRKSPPLTNVSVIDVPLFEIVFEWTQFVPSVDKNT